MPERPSRRLVLTGALALSASALTGCGVRLEDDAPDIPFVPTRQPIPGESALLAFLGTLDASDETHAGARADALREALRDARVPETLLTGATAPASDAETVTAVEGSVRECAPAMLQLVGQLAATHRITTGLGEDPDLWTPAPETPWGEGSPAATALQATRATAYAVDVVAARASGRVREDMLETAGGLGRLAVRQATAAGDAVEPAPLGYDRPDDLTGTAGRDWVVGAFIRMQAAYATGFTHLGEDRDAALELVGWMVTAQELSRAQFLQDVPQLYGDGEHQP